MAGSFSIANIDSGSPSCCRKLMPSNLVSANYNYLLKTAQTACFLQIFKVWYWWSTLSSTLLWRTLSWDRCAYICLGILPIWAFFCQFIWEVAFVWTVLLECILDCVLNSGNTSVEPHFCRLNLLFFCFSLGPSFCIIQQYWPYQNFKNLTFNPYGMPLSFQMLVSLSFFA